MRERRSIDTRNKILEVAEGEFAREGYAGAHLQRIAEQVGVQKTALYYYFVSKAALYEEVLVLMLQEFERTVIEAVSTKGSPRERLERLLDSLNALLAEKRHYSQILIRIFVDRPPVSGSRIRPLIESAIGQVLTFYKEGVDAGAFRPLSSRHVFQTILGGMLFHYASGAFGAAVLGIDDLFTHTTVAWRRAQVKALVHHGVLEGEKEPVER